jgi:hypothetical protein
MKKIFYNETDPELRAQEMAEIIQRNYDDDNWYGYNATRAKITLAAQLEYIKIKGTDFKPKYNCPA